MKKLLILCFVSCLLLVACVGEGTPADTTNDVGETTPAITETTEPTETRTAAEIAETVMSRCSFSEELMQNNSYLSHHLYDFAALDAHIADSAAYIPIGITPEEVLVFIANDEAGVKALCDKLTSYIDYQASEYGDYKPSEVPKLDGAVIETKGNVVIYVVSMDNTAASDVARDVLGK